MIAERQAAEHDRCSDRRGLQPGGQRRGEDRDVADEPENRDRDSRRLRVLRVLNGLAAAGCAREPGAGVAGVDEVRGDGGAGQRESRDRGPQAAIGRSQQAVERRAEGGDVERGELKLLQRLTGLAGEERRGG